MHMRPTTWTPGTRMQRPKGQGAERYGPPNSETIKAEYSRDAEHYCRWYPEEGHWGHPQSIHPPSKQLFTSRHTTFTKGVRSSPKGKENLVDSRQTQQTRTKATRHH